MLFDLVIKEISSRDVQLMTRLAELFSEAEIDLLWGDEYVEAVWYAFERLLDSGIDDRYLNEPQKTFLDLIRQRRNDALDAAEDALGAAKE
jgi:hypothetical protein